MIKLFIVTTRFRCFESIMVDFEKVKHEIINNHWSSWICMGYALFNYDPFWRFSIRSQRVEKGWWVITLDISMFPPFFQQLRGRWSQLEKDHSPPPPPPKLTIKRQWSYETQQMIENVTQDHIRVWYPVNFTNSNSLCCFTLTVSVAKLSGTDSEAHERRVTQLNLG